MRIWEEGYVEVRGLLCLAVEPEARDDGLHGGLDLAWRSLRLLRHASVAPREFAERLTRVPFLIFLRINFPLRHFCLAGLSVIENGTGKRIFNLIGILGHKRPYDPRVGFT